MKKLTIYIRLNELTNFMDYVDPDETVTITFKSEDEEEYYKITAPADVVNSYYENTK